MLITKEIMRDHSICVSGSRVAFESCGLDFIKFIKHGLDSETLLASKHPVIVETVQKVLAVKK